MSINTRSDGHIHTAYCHHAVGTMEEYVLAAIAKGLRQIFFLEHMEEGIRTRRVTWLTEADFDSYFSEGERLKTIYGDVIDIGLGVEVGYSPRHREKLRERLSMRKWDRVGISCHFAELTTDDFHLNLVSKKDSRLYTLSNKDQVGLIRDYYTQLREAILYLPGNVVCHLDAVLRYLPPQDEDTFPNELFHELLAAIKQRKMAVEINTSGMAIRNECFPAAPLLAQVIKHNIPLVAGSDAHRPEDVGNHFEILNDLIYKAQDLS